MTDERVLTWERLYRVSATPEERKELRKLAETSRESQFELLGLMRSTYPEGHDPE